MNPTPVPLNPGDQYGHLTVLGVIRRPCAGRPSGERAVLVQCDCGEITSVRPVDLRRYQNPSCGCQRRPTHGLSSHPLFRTWKDMLRRCEDPRVAGYETYGGRGIQVSAEFHDPRKFIAYIEVNLGSRPAGMELDRIDADRGYEAGNLRWATKAQQQANVRKKGIKSRYKGVAPAGSRWRARLQGASTYRHLGCFDSEEEAARAYDAAALEVWGEFARLNFPVKEKAA